MSTKRFFMIIAAGLSILILSRINVLGNHKANLMLINHTLQDTINPNKGGMMGNGMMGGRMMGRGMMGRGMMGNSRVSTGRTDKNGYWIAPSSAKELINPIKNIAEASKKGKNLFESQCFTCHGYNGKGNGPVAVSLNPKPSDLTSVRVRRQSDGEIYWKITNGNLTMPSFKNNLSSNQRWELVDFIRQLHNQQ